MGVPGELRAERRDAGGEVCLAQLDQLLALFAQQVEIAADFAVFLAQIPNEHLVVDERVHARRVFDERHALRELARGQRLLPVGGLHADRGDHFGVAVPAEAGQPTCPSAPSS